MYTNKGRQKKDEIPIVVSYKKKLKYFPDKEKIQKAINCKGKFILATNELDYCHLLERRSLNL
jgi:hypothetical protein